MTVVTEINPNKPSNLTISVVRQEVGWFQNNFYAPRGEDLCSEVTRDFGNLVGSRHLRETRVSAYRWWSTRLRIKRLAIKSWILRRDRARIVVTAKAGYRYTGNGPSDPNKNCILFTIYNSARRPKTIETVGLRRRSGQSKCLIAAELLQKSPQELAEIRSFTLAMEQEKIDLDTIEHPGALDQTGMYHRGNLGKT